ncbi:MAG: MaoC family dehydratase [Candidatus Protistobacter heckmanni]|nr:MaoC family dehydratase [Candidatus Protistobacter heckmanni]
MSANYDSIQAGTAITGTPFHPTRESIREFCEASLDFNPLHLDDEYMKGNFGKTHFGGIIMHGMNNFGVISKMISDWLYPMGGVHRRLETRWKNPVKSGDMITPHAVVTSKKTTGRSRWATLDVEVKNQRGEVVASGEAMVEFHHSL